jgi:hypothetical protein
MLSLRLRIILPVRALPAKGHRTFAWLAYPDREPAWQKGMNNETRQESFPTSFALWSHGGCDGNVFRKHECICPEPAAPCCQILSAKFLYELAHTVEAAGEGESAEKFRSIALELASSPEWRGDACEGTAEDEEEQIDD